MENDTEELGGGGGIQFKATEPVFLSLAFASLKTPQSELLPSEIIESVWTGAHAKQSIEIAFVGIVRHFA